MAAYAAEFGKDGRRVEPDGRLDAPAFHRNHRAIWELLGKFLAGKSGDVVEAGSGTGQHVVEFARHTPDITWWPSDLHEQHLKSIDAWRSQAGLANVRPPLRIDLSDPAWCPKMHDGSGPGELLAVFCANVIHIAPWRVAEGLFAGAGRYLRPDGRLLLYGPFKRAGKHTAVSNAVFDASLRGQCGMGRARHRGFGTTGGKHRSGSSGDRRYARQQSDSGVWTQANRLNARKSRVKPKRFSARPIPDGRSSRSCFSGKRSRAL